MIPAPEYRYIEQLLNLSSLSVGSGYAEGIPADRSIIGFILFDQNFRRAAVDDILNNLEMLNRYSGKYVHFFLCGVSLYAGNSEDSSKEIGKLAGRTAYHNAKAAVSFIDGFQRDIKGWTYGDGVELILLDVITVAGVRKYDFESAVYFKIDQLIKQSIIDRPSELFGKIIRLVRDSRVKNTTELKDAFRADFGSNWFRAFILSLFPKSFGKLARGEAVLGGGSAVPEH